MGSFVEDLPAEGWIVEAAAVQGAFIFRHNWKLTYVYFTPVKGILPFIYESLPGLFACPTCRILFYIAYIKIRVWVDFHSLIKSKQSICSNFIEFKYIYMTKNYYLLPATKHFFIELLINMLRELLRSN